MSASTRPTDFFVAGGTMDPDLPSYVERPADDELFDLTLAGEFCYVLTPRQMGKSSLMVRTADRLEADGVCTAIIDLTTIGTAGTADTWYLDLVSELADQLDLSVDPEAWWQARASLGQVRRFVNFLRDVVLTEITGQVVIFVDEIDATLALDFSDDFFAAIRATYNARATDPTFNCLTFVLVGVATPSDLVSDQARTPFNIGHAIDLQELSWADAQVLQSGWSGIEPGRRAAILERIFYWTNGHPYLTQKLCLTVAERGDEHWTDARVDELVKSLFLSEKARNEANLKFVRDRILAHPQKRQLLALYRQVHKGKRIGEDERSLAQNQLRLAGLVKTENGVLRVRNEVYRHAFDLTWVRENVAISWLPIVKGITIPVFLLVLLTMVGLILHNPEKYYDPVVCSLFPSERWCSHNSELLKGKKVFALASCDNGTLFAGAVDGIYRLTPGDTEWEREKRTDSDVRGLAASPDCTLVYAAAPGYGVLSRGGGLWSSASWDIEGRPEAVALSDTAILAGGEFGVRYSLDIRKPFWGKPPPHLDGTSVVNLVWSGERVYAATWGKGVWYSSGDDLEQWWPENDGLGTQYVLQVIGSPASGVPRFAGVNGGFYRWNGTQWEEGIEPWENTRIFTHTFCFAIDDATVYAGQENNGVLRSTDGGLTWEQMNTGWRTLPFQVRTLLIQSDEDGRRWLYAGTDDGVWHYLLPELTTTPTVIAPTPSPTDTTPTPPITVPSLTPITPTPTATDTPTPTHTLTPTHTSSPTPLCDLHLEFLDHLTIPNDTHLPSGTRFTKIWQLRKTNLCPWPEGSRLVFVSGDQMGGPGEHEVAKPPGFDGNEVITTSIDLVSPVSSGNYEGIWQIQDADGDPISEELHIRIIVYVPALPVPSPELIGTEDRGCCNVAFKWNWSGTLADDEWFGVRVGIGTPQSVVWAKEADLAVGDHYEYTYPISQAGTWVWEVVIYCGEPGMPSWERRASSEQRSFVLEEECTLCDEPPAHR